MTAPAPRPLIYIHVPKVAGTTLQELLARQYAAGRGFIFTGDQEQYAQFIALASEDRAKFDLLMGHVQFGIHEHLTEPATYITMLRDPMDRVVSHYHFILANEDHYLHGALRTRGWTLSEWLAVAPIVLDNYQLRWLTARPLSQVPAGKVTRAMLDEAKWNLENAFHVVGLMERFEDTLACFRRAFGWRLDDAGGRRLNANPGRPSMEEIDSDTLAAIREANRFDIELYDHACMLFEEQCRQLRINLAQPNAEALALAEGVEP
jgi:hypothetical protein